MRIAIVEGGEVARRRRVVAGQQLGIGATPRVGVGARGGGGIALTQQSFAALVGIAPER